LYIKTKNVGLLCKNSVVYVHQFSAINLTSATQPLYFEAVFPNGAPV